MLTSREYIKQSIETNLFFLRIIKEHLIFTSAALMPKDAGMVPQLMGLKSKFEELLVDTVSLSSGVIGPKELAVGDIITPYTYKAEMATQYLTGLPIDMGITNMEASLIKNTSVVANPMLEQSVNILNQNIMGFLNYTIQMKKMLISNILSCKMATNMYPLMLEHVTREAEHYMHHLQMLQSRQSLETGGKQAAMHEVFWDEIMGEHAKFIRGLLDPTEEELIQKANSFAGEFEELTKATKDAYKQLELLPEVTQKNIAATTDLRDFKQQGTQGILECRIRSIILPLLSDHVLREANHFLKELHEVNG